MKEIYLYSKTECIAKLEKDNFDNIFLKEVLIPEKMPILLKNNPKEKFPVWLEKRCIPKSREGIIEARKEFGQSWNKPFNYASLTDQYWIKQRQNDSWNKVNFFTNVYSKEVGDIFFCPWTINTKKINTFSPDLTTNGILKKRWIQKDDLSSALVKAGSVTMHQEPLSEVLASVLMERLNIIPFVRYDLHVEGTTMCSICDNFIDENLEFVPAYHIYLDEEKAPDDTVYNHLIKMCDKYEIEGAQKFIEGMIFIDRETNNQDRNLGNMGFLRDVSTGKIIGPAPLFDSGTAYWATKPNVEKLQSKLFHDVEDEVCKKVEREYNFSGLNLNYGFEELIMNYPNISFTKKESLIKAIKNSNRALKRGKEKESLSRDNIR